MGAGVRKADREGHHLNFKLKGFMEKARLNQEDDSLGPTMWSKDMKQHEQKPWDGGVLETLEEEKEASRWEQSEHFRK